MAPSERRISTNQEANEKDVTWTHSTETNMCHYCEDFQKDHVKQRNLKGKFTRMRPVDSERDLGCQTIILTFLDLRIVTPITHDEAAIPIKPSIDK